MRGGGQTPRTKKAGDMHPTGMFSCSQSSFL